MNEPFIKNIKSMMHSPIHNYIVPGLTSWLIGDKTENGTVRLFTCSRNHQESIIPHSHRYDFQCLVLQEKISNFIWEKDLNGDEFMVSIQSYKNDIGKYDCEQIKPEKYSFKESIFRSGYTYGLTHDKIHSIQFYKDSMVLFFEGPTLTNQSVFLEPIVNGKVIPTSEIKYWMFEKQ